MLSEVQGQNESVRYLRKVIAGSFTSPLLLVGPEGVGRKFAVLSAAKEEFATTGAAEFHLKQIARGVHPDIHILHPDEGKDLGISEVRELLEVVTSYPSSAPMRYAILDGADRLTDAAANALLKTLEEPSPTTRFFLLAENAGSVIPTIRSRCAELRFRALPEEFVVECLRRHTDDPNKALVYSRISEGSVGRALQYLGSGRLTIRDEMLALLKQGPNGDLSSLFSAVDEMKSLRLGLRFLEHLLRDLLMIHFDPTSLTNVDIARDLELLRPRLGEHRIWALMDGLRKVLRHPPSMNLSFHFKTVLASTFAE